MSKKEIIQNQIYEEKVEEEKEEKADMKGFLKDLKGIHQRVDYASDQVQQQDKKLVGVNEKLDQYNNEVSQGEDLLDVVNHGVFGSIFNSIKNLFKSKESNEITNKEKKLLNKAKNKELKINEEDDKVHNFNIKNEGEWEIIKKEKKKNVDEMDDDEIIEEAIKEGKEMVNSGKNLNNNIKESIEVVKITNKNMDKTSKHVKKAIQKMEDD